MIAPEEDEVMVRILKLIPNTLLTSPFLEPLVNTLMEEKESYYYNSLMKSIGKAGGAWCEGSYAEGPFLLLTLSPLPRSSENAKAF